MPYIGNTPAEKYAAFDVQHFTTSATTGYTLTHAVANENDIRLVINNVVQQPGASYAYTASGTTLTLSSATSGTDTMYCVFLGKAVQTVVPPAGSVTEPTIGASNSPTNGYVLSAQSGAAGGLTWAADAAGTITAFTNGVDNRLVTATSATALNGESTLTYDGTQLVLTDATEGTDNLLVKTTADGSISMALEKSDLKYDLGLDHNNDGSQNFYIRERTKNGSTTNSKRMVIDNDGEITQPLQPTFMVSQTGSLSVANGHTLFSTNTTERWDVGSNFSGGTFTAPVTGKYFLNYNMLYEDASGSNVFEDIIVTSNRSYAMWRNSSAYSSGTTYLYNALSVIADMDASDTAYVQHGGGQTATVHYSNGNWPWFQGYLLG